MKKVLIIEDEKPLRDAFKFLLTQAGFLVDTAENGKVGLEKLAEFKPNLVILDMLMPVLNGMEFLDHAQLKQTYPDVKLVVLSNLSDSISMEDARSYGVASSFVKANLAPGDLVNIANQMLEIK